MPKTNMRSDQNLLDFEKQFTIGIGFLILRNVFIYKTNFD